MLDLKGYKHMAWVHQNHTLEEKATNCIRGGTVEQLTKLPHNFCDVAMSPTSLPSTLSHSTVLMLTLS